MKSTDTLLEQATEAADRGDWTGALLLYEQVLSGDPQHSRALCGKANLLRRKGDTDAADGILRSALEVHPDDAELLVERGELSFGSKQMDTAEECFTRALRVDQKNTAAAMGLADVFTETGRGEQAQALLEDYRRRDPEDLDIALRLGWNRLKSNRPNSAMAEFKRALGDPTTAYSARLGIAHVYLVAHDFSGSKSELRAAIESDPECAAAYCNLAWVCAVERRDLDEAAGLCEQALKLDAGYASALDCLGVISFQQQNLRQAEHYFRTAIEINPTDAGTLVRLGLLYVQLGDLSEARRFFDEALEQDPWNDLALCSRGGVLYQSRELPLALRDFQRATVTNPQNGLACSGSALTLARMGRFADACSLLHAGLARVPSRDCWQLRLSLAQVLVQAGQELKDDDLFVEALEEAERAELEHKGSKEICFIAGIAAAKTNDYAKAETYFQEVVKLDSLDSRAKRSLRLVQTLTARRKRAELVSPKVKWTLFVFVLLQIAALWFDFPRKISGVQFAALLPVFVGLMLIVLFLPRLIELKLPGGFEAKLEAATEVKPAESLLQLRPDEALPSVGIVLGLPSGD